MFAWQDPVVTTLLQLDFLDPIVVSDTSDFNFSHGRWRVLRDQVSAFNRFRALYRLPGVIEKSDC